MSQWYARARQLAPQYGIDPDLAERVMRQESGGNPNAVSSAGALGLMQLMPGTAADLGVDPRDPVQNIHGGLRYLKEQMDRFGSVPLALAAYNAGPGAVEKHGGIPPYSETQNYVARIAGKSGGAPDVRMAAVGAGPSEISDVTDRTPTGDPITGRMDMPLPQFPAPRPAPVPPALDVDLEALKPSPIGALADSLMMAGAMFGNRPTPLRGALGAGVMGGASDLELLQLKHRIAQSQYERERAIWENEQAAAQVAQQEHFLQQLPPAQQTLARAMGAEDYAKVHANQLADQQKIDAMLGAEQQKLEAMQGAFGPAGGAAYRVDPDLQQIMAGGVMGPDDVVKEQERRNRETESAIVATRKEFGKAADPAAFAIKTWEQSKDMPPPDQMNAIQDVQLVKAYSKMLLPEEAVMGQDTVTLASAGNSMLESMWKQVITGEGQLSEDQRKWIFEQMDDLAKSAAQDHAKQWGRYYDIAQNRPGMARLPPEQRQRRVTDIIGPNPAVFNPRTAGTAPRQQAADVPRVPTKVGDTVTLPNGVTIRRTK